MCAEDELVLVSEVQRRTPVFTPEHLDAIPALPHTTTDKLFVLDLQALQGERYGGVSALYLCAGVLTSMVVDVTEGVHLKRVRILERNPRRRAQAEKVLQLLHTDFLERVPGSAIDRAFTWADAIDHDGYLLDGSMLYREFGADCELMVHIEAGCQGHSVLGPKNGFNHPESGALVPMAAALSDLQFILAKERGFRDWSSAPAQFGYVMENVPGPYSPTQHTDDTRRASAFMDRVLECPCCMMQL
jgi:hypothetical protein